MAVCAIAPSAMRSARASTELLCGDRVPRVTAGYRSPFLSIPANLSLSSSVPSSSGANAGSPMTIRRAEELIATLPGVMAVRIVPNSNGDIDEIHVITTTAVLPKQTVRNIESALMAQLGWRVNHKKISIAQSLDPPHAADTHMQGDLRVPRGSGGDGPTGAIPSAGLADVATPLATPLSVFAKGRRVLIFDDVEVRRSRSRGVLCRVTLIKDGVTYVGEAEGQETERSRVELASRAALTAVQEATKDVGEGERALALEGSKVIDAFDREFIFVSVAARIGRDRLVLTGSCEVRDSAETSAVLAVLDATNRWMQLDK
jgi:hypothetical protein